MTDLTTSKRVYYMRALLIIVSLALSAVLAEAGLRLVHYEDGRVHMATFTQYDPLLGWRIAPNASTEIVTKEYRTTLKYGPKGLRGRDHLYDKAPGASRIVVLGDSMVDGFSVPLQDRISEVLEAQVAPTEVINLGVSAYSTDQELLMLETEGWKYQPDLVFLVFYYNDIWMNGDPLLGGATRKPFFNLDKNGNLVLKNVPVPKPAPALEDRSKFYSLLRDTIKSRAWLYPPPTLPMPAGAGGTVDQFRVYQKTETPEVHRVWAITQALLQRMNRETQQHGSSFVVFYVPTRVELSPEEWSSSRIPPEYGPSVVVRRVESICKAEGIPLIEPSSLFKEATKQNPLYYQQDVHLTPAGHHLAAKLLAEYVHNTWRGANQPAK